VGTGLAVATGRSKEGGGRRLVTLEEAAEPTRQIDARMHQALREEAGIEGSHPISLA
jgi:hypothetical protein